MSTNRKRKSAQVTDHKAFSDHINELRMRVIWVVLAFIITSAIAYNYRDLLVHVVLAPLGNQKLVYLTPAGGFAFIFQITMYAAAVVTAPLLIYQLYKFVQPALPLRAKRASVRVVLASVALMIGGVCFGYFVAVPAALHFLTAFAGSYVEASLTADSYLNFIVAYVVGLGLLFQLPLLLVFWNWIRPMSTKKLFASQRFIILFAFIAAAMITPTPDPTNQAMIAVPIILIYQIGVVAVLLINRSASARRKQTTVSSIAPADASADSTFPELPALEPTEPEMPAQAVTPSEPTPIEPVIPQAPVVKKKPVIRIEDMRRLPSRPAARVRPMQRAEAKLVAPARRPAPGRPSRGMSIDGIRRDFRLDNSQA